MNCGEQPAFNVPIQVRSGVPTGWRWKRAQRKEGTPLAVSTGDSSSPTEGMASLSWKWYRFNSLLSAVPGQVISKRCSEKPGTGLKRWDERKKDDKHNPRRSPPNRDFAFPQANFGQKLSCQR